MAEFFDYNPLTGIRYDFDFDDMTDTAVIHKTQDIEPILSYAHALRVAGGTREKLKQDDFFCLHAVIPPIVQMQMLKRGVNVFDRNDSAKVYQLVEKEYPALKCTDLKISK